ncbi:response regulator transcription factor [Reinekea sp. G2M2-21]|uniref:response regulator transcription factor n=1 Tax=Reinekea sp. G2M2-21 TaxID=2788942 RepID=UPI0018AAA367|nr:response regulator transcription factor [Reinekea sp. G2M2-21]
MTQYEDQALILAVDDSPDALSMVHDALEAAGMDVLVALEGKQALSIAQRMKPDIILLDAMMPVMDGFETCRRLKENPRLSDIPVIFMTGLGESEDVVRGLECGGVDYLTKPIRPDELLARIRVHLTNARITRSAHSALDKAGQILLSVNSFGEQNWATPQAFTLLAKARLNQIELYADVALQLRRWLRREPDVGHSLTLTDLSYPLLVKIVSRQGQEWILKLIDGERASGSAILREQLGLTERESEVIYWIANGKTNREAAEILTMSPRTVNKHLEQIYAKLQVDNRTSAAGIALKVLALSESFA